MIVALIVVVSVLLFAGTCFAGDEVFPNMTWEARSPQELGMDGATLDRLADALGGRGCVIKDGYLVKQWGDPAERSDWMSSVKPVFSTLLFFAIEEGKVPGVDHRIADLGWELEPKDREMTFYHLANMISGYARPEPPGAAWAYNDPAIQLYQKSLFEKVFHEDATDVLMARLGDLGFEDRPTFREDKPRLRASARDFARLAWFWCQKGKWQGKQLLPQRYFDLYMQPQTPKELPNTQGEDTGDYLGIGSFGGGSDHFTKYGAGIYGFNWWFNDTGRLHPDRLTWPDAPKETIMSIGAGGNNAVIIPSLNLVLVSAKGDWGKLDAGNPDSKFNRHIQLLVDAVGQARGSVSDAVDVAVFDVRDFELRSDSSHENPFEVALRATFTHTSGKTLHVPGFYDGEGLWLVRFSPVAEGLWRGVTQSDDPQMDGVELPVVNGVPNENPSIHGRVQVDPPHRFRFEDGTVFIPLGFEWDWMSAYHQEHGTGGASDRDNPSFDAALDLLCESGFNFIMANLYAHYYHRTEVSDRTRPYLYQYPRLYPFGGTNDNADHSRLNVAFFQMFDRAVESLHQRGLVLHLMMQVQNKKVNWPDRASAEDDRFWQYVVARYQAFGNVIWDVSKETYNLLNRTGSHEYALSRIGLIREMDGYDHLVTAHDTERESWGKETVVDAACDFISDQVKFGGTVDGWHLASADKLNREAIRRWRNVDKPYLNNEYGYEAGNPPLAAPIPKMTVPGETMLLWTWALYAGGAYANYYYCNTSWDIVRFDPVPESWARFRYLSDFLKLMDFNRLVPDNDFVSRGMCSAEPGKQYFVFLPDGGHTQIDLSAVEADRRVDAIWMDIWTGERIEGMVEDVKFTTSLNNPLSRCDRPCAVFLKVGSPR